MIEIKEKGDCCGCNACVQRCPKSCITMQEDYEGFLYPIVNKEACVDCGICEQVCPVINQAEERTPLSVYAAKHKNEQIRLASSSGGAFTAIAEYILDNGGVVFGARFNKDWSVIHSYTETKDGLADFRGSKYVQSYIGESYKEAETFLKAGRKVLFSGTPCQISGLKRFLRKEYKNLLTVDFVCHGVPSPGVWREYLKEETNRQYSKNKSTLYQSDKIIKTIYINNISFRNKRLGWKNYSLTFTLSIPNKHGYQKTIFYSSSRYHNPFLKGFLRDLYLRPSCHYCVAKGFRSGSDLTIADFWSINKYIPQENDKKGYSLLFIHRDDLNDYIMKVMKMTKIDNIKLLQNNSTIYKSTHPHKNRMIFFDTLREKDQSLIELIKKYATISFKKKIKLLIAELLNS